MLDENIELLKGEMYNFAYKGRKKSGKQARAILSNIKKLCHNLRMEINDDIKALPTPKRNISPEAIERAKAKRRATLAAKKNK